MENDKNSIVPVGIVPYPETHLIGLSASVRGEKSAQGKRIRELWQAFNGMLWKIKNRSNREEDWAKYGVTFNSQPGDHYDYLAAVAVDNTEHVPEGMIAKTISPVTYAKFCHRGSFWHLGKTVHAIYNKWLPEAQYHMVPAWQCGMSHFEYYDQRFQWQDEKSEIDIFVPVRPKE